MSEKLEFYHTGKTDDQTCDVFFITEGKKFELTSVRKETKLSDS